MPTLHEDEKAFTRYGLSSDNLLIARVSGTFHQNDTDLATYKATNNTQAKSYHEDEEQLFRRNNTLHTILYPSHFDATDIAAANSTSTWEARYTADDPSLPADYNGRRFADD